MLTQVLTQVLFVHGSGECAEAFRFQLAAFPSARAVNLPGHPDGELLDSVSTNAAWLHRYAQQEGLRNFVLCGHSLGGAIALQYALDYPSDLRGLVLLGAGARLKVHPSFLEPLVTAVAGRARWIPDATNYQRIEPDLATVLTRRRIENGAAAMLNDLSACNTFDITQRLSEIRLPVLALVGSEDVMTPPKYSSFLAAQLPHCEMTVIEGASHWGFAEKPDEFNAAIETFVAKLAT